MKAFFIGIWSSVAAYLLITAMSTAPKTAPSWIRNRVNAKIAADERAAAAQLRIAAALESLARRR